MVLHVKCPLCPEILETEVVADTWGFVRASDGAFVVTTSAPPSVRAHILAHGVTARLGALRREYVTRSQDDYPAMIARIDEQIEPRPWSPPHGMSPWCRSQTKEN